MAIYKKSINSSSMQAIHQFIEHHASQIPDFPAIAYNDNILTYKSLNLQANQLANYLIAFGVKPKKKIGIAITRSPELIISILAVWKAGCAYVPIDSDYPKQRIQEILADSAIQVLITKHDLLEKLPEIPIPKICIDDKLLSLTNYAVSNPVVNVNQAHSAYLLYTSGSTGTPKGVMITHGNLIATYLGWLEVYQLTAQDCHLQMANMTFDVFSGDLMRALCSGAKLVLCPKLWLLNPKKLIALMQSEAINCAEFVPVVLRKLVAYVKKTQQSLSFMRLLVCGSDNWLLSEYRELKHYCGTTTRVINSYGLTETTIDSTWFEEDIAYPIALASNHYVPIGKPFPQVEIYLLDPQLKPVAKEQIGEIYIAGAGVGKGYLNKPELTKQRFVKLNINNQMIKAYKTGDSGRYLADDTIEFLGRLDTQTKLNGIRIDLSEIEYTIKSYPAIQEAVCIIRNLNQNRNQLIAYIVSEQEIPVSLKELREFLKKCLPQYCIPHQIILLNSLPITPNGKVDRQALIKHEFAISC